MHPTEILAFASFILTICLILTLVVIGLMWSYCDWRDRRAKASRELHRSGIRLMAVLFMASACVGARAQISTNGVTLTNPPPVVTLSGKVLGFLSQGSNFLIAPYGIYSTGTKSAGGGVAVAYKVNDFVLPTIRLDYLDKNFYQGDFTTQLQYPITLSQSNLTVIPFVLGGVATPFGGAGSANTTVQGIAGLGMALRLDFLGGFGKQCDLVADWEKWSASPGDQYRFGIAIKLGKNW